MTVQLQEAPQARHSERAGLGTVGPGPTALGRTCILPQRVLGTGPPVPSARLTEGGIALGCAQRGSTGPGWTCCSWHGPL